MKKTIVAAAIAAAVAAPAAMAEVSLYGKAHLAMEWADNNGDNVDSNASRFGIKANEDLGNGMSAFVKYEFGADAIDGDAGLTARDANMGIKGDFGTLAFGRMGAPVKGVLYGIGNVQLADANNGTDFASGFFSKGTRADNVVAYSNNMGGLDVTIGTSGDDAGDNFEGKHISLKTNVGGATVALGNYDASGTKATIVGAKMSMDALTASVVYEDVDPAAAAADYDTTGVSLSYKMGANTISASYSTRDTSGSSTDTDKTTFGIQHSLSKKTSIYASYGETDTTTTTDTTSVGMIMSF